MEPIFKAPVADHNSAALNGGDMEGVIFPGLARALSINAQLSHPGWSSCAARRRVGGGHACLYALTDNGTSLRHGEHMSYWA